jgi:uncharacterized membrane protein HdeD (DUF308 family)
MNTTTIASEAKRFTGWSIAAGAFMILAGILAIGMPLAAGVAVNVLVAWLLVFCGLAHFVFAWHLRGAGGILWQVLLGVLYLGIGVYLLMHPVAGLVTLTVALAIYLFLEGVFELLLAFQLGVRNGRGWLVLDGVVTLILSVLIWKSWPASTDWVIGTLVGVSMLFSGITRLMFSLAGRSLLTRTA